MTTADNSIQAEQIVCPTCDALYAVPEGKQTKAQCVRCGTVLIRSERAAIAEVVGLSLASSILMVLVLTLPFLKLDRGMFGSTASVIDAVMSFSSGLMVPVSIATLAFIIVLPITRFATLVYALTPAVFDSPALPGAKQALRLALALKPWAMAEIFMIGVAVALVKLTEMASVAIGPAFWAFGAVVVLSALSERFLCRHTLWTTLK